MRPNVSVAGVLLTTMLLLTSLSVHSQEPVLATEKDAWARPLVVVTPVFPKDVPPATLPVEIRVNGTVSTDGKFNSPVFTPAEGRESFVQSVKDVLPHWRFRPAFDGKTCETKESEASFIVYFELKGGAASISVSSPVVEKPKPNDDVLAQLDYVRFSRSAKIVYPEAALKAGIEGFAEISMQVNNEGDIISKSVISSTPNSLFGDAALQGLLGARFSKNEGRRPADKPQCAIWPVNFCIRGLVSYPDPHCRS